MCCLVIYLVLFFASRLIEEKAYTFMDFFSDLGGISGLLLGLSAYDAFDQVKERLLRAWAYIRKWLT